jgi:transposase
MEGHRRGRKRRLLDAGDRQAHRFVVLTKRWTVERTLAWISRKNRGRLHPPRHDQDHASTLDHATSHCS